MSFVPSDLANILFWHDLGLSTEAVNADGTGGAPTDGQDMAWMTSLVNDGITDDHWTLLSTDIANRKQPVYHTNVLNSLPAAFWPVTDGIHNSLLFTMGNQPAINGDPGLSVYCVARWDGGSDSAYRALWQLGQSPTGNAYIFFGAYQGKWTLDVGGAYQQYGTVDSSWHTLSIVKPTGNFLSGVKFYIDGVLQTVSFSTGTDQPINILSGQMILGAYNTGAAAGNCWQGYITADVGYKAAHNDTDRGKVEAYLNCRYFNIDCPAPGGGTILRPGLGLSGLGSGGPFFSNPLECRVRHETSAQTGRHIRDLAGLHSRLLVGDRRRPGRSSLRDVRPYCLLSS